MNIIEEHVWEGRRMLVTWRNPGFTPPRDLVTQAGGICFTDAGFVVLVTADGKSWGLPGGHPEAGESIEEALIREVKEEACATVTNLVYLGAQEVKDEPDYAVHYQTRFWARVQLNEFKVKYETTGRKLVKPADIISTVRWDSRIFEDTIKVALECERMFNTNKWS